MPGHQRPIEEVREAIEQKRSQKKYHVAVIGHFADRKVRFNTIIFEACIGKIYKAKNVIWEFEKGNHYIKYKAFYVNAKGTYSRPVGFNG